MFTGIVHERGRLSAPPRPLAAAGLRLEIAHSPELGERLAVGASLAVSGVCLTVVERRPTTIAVDVSPETLARTTLGGLRAGDEVNLEAPLRPIDPLGGHWVQGHVDAVVAITARRDQGEFVVLACELPAGLAAFVVEKGSVAIDGVSLTIAALQERSFEVALIPHTLARTTLGDRRPGDPVNLEVDILAKYVQRALQTMGVGAGSPRR
jgi:riboflavin synthase